MGIQASTAKKAVGRNASESSKKSTRKEKVRIDILAFEVASVMSKSVQLWQSLNDQDILRFRAEVMKSSGVLNLVSGNESVLLSLACLEKLQDLASIAFAVSRLGKRCQDPVLVGFQHIFNDILKQTIDVQELVFSHKEMETKIRKMEKCIGTTSTLYQELEVLAEMEQAVRRLREEADPAQKDDLFVLEQRVTWQRHEIKYLKEVSLWNRTYDKIVGLLAKTVCTIYGRIIRVFGFPIMGWPQILTMSRNGEVDRSSSITSCLSTEEAKISNDSANGYVSPVSRGPAHSLSEPEVFPNGQKLLSNGSLNHTKDWNISIPPLSSTFSSPSDYRGSESYRHLSLCFSPGRQFTRQRSMSANYGARDDISTGSSPSGTPFHDDFISRSGDPSGFLFPNSRPFSQQAGSKMATKLHFDPKVKLQNAPLSTLGGAGLALHYANVVIVAEKMARYPHLISRDARDDLYHMLPKSLRLALRAQLKPCTRVCGSSVSGESGLAVWKEDLERLLGWLAPMAHNMIRWQSEHNFEQQQLIPRTNILLLQTLYFADQGKADAAVTDLLVSLNHLWKHERVLKTHSLMDYSTNKDFDEFLEWHV